MDLLAGDDQRAMFDESIGLFLIRVTQYGKFLSKSDDFLSYHFALVLK